MEFNAVVTAKTRSGARLNVDTARGGFVDLNLLGAKHVTAEADGPVDSPYIVIRGTYPVVEGLSSSDVTIVLSLGHASAIASVAMAEMERLAKTTEQPAEVTS